ncbi:hypothetical protein evm_014492 [Chilo suppressalis]|nr:hypothetical protein evm_014492 [Chilo suppressalis]
MGSTCRCGLMRRVDCQSRDIDEKLVFAPFRIFFAPFAVNAAPVAAPCNFSILICEPLRKFSRCLQVTDIPAWALGSLLRVARASLPQGCTLNVHEHMPEHEEVRYVPDNELKQLKQQLEDMGGSRAERKKKK